MNGRVALSIITLTVSVLAMSFADALVKLVSGDLTVWQVFAARSAFAIPCLVAVLYFGGGRVPLRAPFWVVVRSLLLIVTWLFYYSSLPFLDLAVAATAVYTNPIWTTLLSAYLLRERVLPTQWLGVALGFLGVAVVLRPGSGPVSAAIILPLCAALTYALAMVLTRDKCRRENPTVVALNLHVAFLVTGVVASLALAIINVGDATRADYPFLLENWRTMGISDWWLMAILGVLSAGFFFGVARAYQVGPPQTMATIDYGYVVFAALWGMMLFGEMPETLTWTGMFLIIVAGLLSSGIFAARAMSCPH